MSRFRCATCGGEYTDRNLDGTEYFHVCPPVTMVRARFDDGTEDERPLRAFRNMVLIGSQAEKDQLVADGADATTIAIERRRREAPRRNARDENTLRREGARGEIRVIKAEGQGRTQIAAAPVESAPVDDAP